MIADMHGYLPFGLYVYMYLLPRSSPIWTIPLGILERLLQGYCGPQKRTCKQRRRDKARHEQGQVGIAFPDPKLLGGSYEAATTRAGARRAV